MFLSALAQSHGLHIARKTANLVRLVHVSDVPAAMLFAERGALVASRKGKDVIGVMRWMWVRGRWLTGC
jgi:hypothetical protein